MTSVYVTAQRPVDVARDVERGRQAGCGRFVLRSLDDGAMLDLERLGAARYAAGLQAVVELDGHSSLAAISGDGSAARMSEAAAAR